MARCSGRPALAALLLVSAGCSTKRSVQTVVAVSNEGSGDVTLVDAARDEPVRTIHVGQRPRGIRASPDGRLLFVALTGSPDARRAAGTPAPRDPRADGIAVVDLDRGVLVRTLEAGRDPEAFDVSADGKRLYVSNEESATLSVVDVASGLVVRRIGVGAEPSGVTISPDGEHVYVTSEAENAVDVVSTSEHRVVARFRTSARPRTVVLNRAGSEAYVTAELGGALHLVDTSSGSPLGVVRTGGDDARPASIALAPSGVRAFVANGPAGTVAEIDLPSRRVVRTLERIGARPSGLALSPDGEKLYVAAGPDLVVVDAARGTTVKRIAVGRGPWRVVVVRRGASATSTAR